MYKFRPTLSQFIHRSGGESGGYLPHHEEVLQNGGWRLHTRLCNFVRNISTNISALGQRTHLKLGELYSLFIVYIFIAGSRRVPNLVRTPYLDFGGNLFRQNRSINPRKPIRSHFHSNKIFLKITPRLHVWETFQAKVLHHWSVNAHLIDWKWKETVLRNTQFSLWCQKKSSDWWKLVTIFFHLDRVIAWLNEVATVAHKPTFG